MERLRRIYAPDQFLRIDFRGAIHLQPAAVILALVVIGTAATTWRTLRIGSFPGRADYLMLMASGCWWAICAILDVSSESLELKLF